MSIIVQNLTKVYERQKAVSDISFTVNQGEIVGFLGPNGAGKSTTMKIATSYLTPTTGRVIVGGFDVLVNPMAVKKITGYLPEHNPLYTDLYVHEYLRFMGKVYGLWGRNLKKRVSEIIELCGLSLEQNKKIENLSKGYRQRVGLAQALIHDPEILILDEPTSGLDPNQLLEVRKLIKDISMNKTVIFSTHIMQEVQALCERVIIINKGEIVANDRLESLFSSSRKGAIILVEFEIPPSLDDLVKLSGVAEVFSLGSNQYRLVASPGVDIRSELFRFATDKNLALVGLKQEENSLENIFRELTM